MHTMDCIPAVVDVCVVYFAVEDEPTSGHSLCYAPAQRPEVGGIVLVRKSKYSEETN